MRKENRATFSTLEEIPVESEICEDEIDKEGIEYLYSVIKNLDVEEQSLIFLYLDGKSYKEISEILGISVSNVGTRLQRVKSKLRKISNENL